MASRALASVQKTTVTNRIGMKLKLIPAGEFLMGSPESELERRENELQHRVRITKPFYMGVYTVTQSQWISVMRTEPWAEKTYIQQGSDYPATYVNHYDAVDFCHKLTELENAPYRLPTEAEWEYACRARSSAAYSFGDTADQLDQYAWFRENAFELGEEYAHRVGQKLPNAFGLYDMHGNVWEWCQYWHGDYPNGPVSDPKGPASGLFRGGGWNCFAKSCRSASRGRREPSIRRGLHGFRVSLSPSGK